MPQIWSFNDISIHAPRAGSDRPPPGILCFSVIFQSTLPVRGATKKDVIDVYKTQISIHAPRAGSDAVCLIDTSFFFISIHAPRAGSDGI